MAIYRQFISLYPNFSCSVSVQKKVFYDMLLTSAQEIPHRARLFPSVPFHFTWKAIQSKVIDPITRDMAYKIAHDILPTNYVLHCRHVSCDPFCVFCPERETATHLFMECPYTRIIWSIVRRWLSSTAGSSFPFKHLTALFNALPKLLLLKYDLFATNF